MPPADQMGAAAQAGPQGGGGGGGLLSTLWSWTFGLVSGVLGFGFHFLGERNTHVEERA